MNDINSPAGLLDDALRLIKIMQDINADAMSWESLLDGRWMGSTRTSEIGKTAAGDLLQLDSEDTTSYITMFKLYVGKWQEAAQDVVVRDSNRGNVLAMVTGDMIG